MIPNIIITYYHPYHIVLSLRIIIVAHRKYHHHLLLLLLSSLIWVIIVYYHLKGSFSKRDKRHSNNQPCNDNAMFGDHVLEKSSS